MNHRRIRQLVLAAFAPKRTTSTAQASVSPFPLVSDARPSPAGPCAVLQRPRVTGGSAPLRTVALPPAPAISWDEPPAGDPDLVRWPVSLVEAHIADQVVAGDDRTIELLEVTGSASRALAVLVWARAGQPVTA